MRALTDAEVLSVWERTRGQRPLGQALACLAFAAPERTMEDWAALPVGRVCRELFRVRVAMFGSRMPGVVACPRCGERLEFAFECQEIAQADVPALGPVRVESGGRWIELRLPTAADLLAVQSAAELFARCTNGCVEPDQAWIEAASASVAEADPLAETLLDLMCPACEHRWLALLDITGYLTREIAHQARRLLGEVHRLAAVYGWGEREILALTAVRRRAYLELAEA